MAELKYGHVYCLTCWWNEIGLINKLIEDHKDQHPDHDVKATDFNGEEI